MFPVKNLFKTSAISLFVIMIGIYGYFEMRDLIFGAKVEILRPLDGQTVTEQMVSVAGSVGQVSWITLNGRNILADESGNFEEYVALVPGLNILSIMTVDKFERENEKKIRLTYKPSDK